MPLHKRAPWHPTRCLHRRGLHGDLGVMSKRATAQSAASSLAHIYKPDPVAAHRVKPPGAGRTSSVAGAERERVDERRRVKESQARSKAASNNEQQIAMGTWSLPLLPCWTNRRVSGGIQEHAIWLLHSGLAPCSPLLFFKL